MSWSGKAVSKFIKTPNPWALYDWFVWFGSCFVENITTYEPVLLQVTIELTEISTFLVGIQAMVALEDIRRGQVLVRDTERPGRQRWGLAAADGLLQFIKLWSVQCCALHSAGKLFLIVLARPDAASTCPGSWNIAHSHIIRNKAEKPKPTEQISSNHPTLPRRLSVNWSMNEHNK